MPTTVYLGNGRSANRYHLFFPRKLTNRIDIKRIFSPSELVWKTLEDIGYTGRLSDLWDDPEAQLVVITTPSQFHYEYGKMALEHDKNILIKKPFAETSKETEELFALAKGKGLFIQCYQNKQFDSDFLTVQKAIKSGKLGDILEVEVHYDYFRPGVPGNTHGFPTMNNYLYGYAHHAVD